MSGSSQIEAAVKVSDQRKLAHEQSRRTEATGWRRADTGRRLSSNTSELPQEKLVKLARAKWPEVASQSVTASARSDNSSSSEISASIKQHQSHQLHHTNQSQQVDNEPLIHTDRLNASSPLLFVHDSRGLQLHHQPQSGSRSAILSAKYRGEPIEMQSSNLNQTTLLESESQSDLAAEPNDPRHSQTVAPAEARLVVIELEVGSSSATLTWAFHMAGQEQDATGGNLAQLKQRQLEGFLEPQVKSVSTSRQPQRRRQREDQQASRVDSETVAKIIVKRDTMRISAAKVESSTAASEQDEDTANKASDDAADEKALMDAVSDLTRDQSNTEPDLMRQTSTPDLKPARKHLTHLPTINDRIQLHQIQPLPANHNRRPPIRSTPAESSSEPNMFSSDLISRLSNKTVTQQLPTSNETDSARSKLFMASTRLGLNRRDRAKASTRSTSTTSPSVSSRRPKSYERDRDSQIIRIPSVAINKLSALTSSTTSTSTTSTTTSTTSSTTTTARPDLATSPSTTTTLAASTDESTTADSTTTDVTPEIPTAESESSISLADIASTTSATTSTTTTTTQPSSTKGGRSTGDDSGVSSSSLSPVNANRRNQAQINSSVDSVEPLMTETPQVEASTKHQTQPEVSKWFVRLRKFASNEVDIVKVVVNNLNKLIYQSPDELRYISFKNLEPNSAYEICIESASPNQQVADKFQILNANHFLKCQDISDAELNNTQSNSPTASTSSPSILQESANSSKSSTSDINQNGKMQSLCREFFTLHRNAVNKIKFAQLIDSSNEQPKESINQISNAHPRRPKSLNNNLRSRMELLEINDIYSSPRMFEISASRNQPLTGLGLSPNPSDVISRISESTVGDSFAGSSETINNNNDFLGVSILPIVSCVFGLIFIVTLTNIILSAISCRSRSASRRHRQLSSNMLTNRNNRNTTLGSFYSNSDRSVTSQSRIVVVGKNGEPFAASSAYFEVPAARPTLLESSSDSNSQTSAGKASSSGNLLGSSARFPLGPSFEGDEKHNADMVGLARKNYDNFIANMYNDDNQNNDAAFRSQHELDTDRRTNNHRHVHHHLSKYSKHRMQSDPKELDSNRLLKSNLSSPNHHDNKTFEPDPERNNTSPSSKARKQRIRFDKINPIYNMEGLYSTTSTSRRTRLSSPGGVSSFGHLNPNLVSDDPSGEQRRSCNMVCDSGEKSLEDQCPLCQQSESSLGVDNCRSELECDSENCNQSLTYTVCCLDKQQQRFQEQQQQLERVVTRSGSIIPQPFIEPKGPDRCVTADCNIRKEHEEQVGATSEARQSSRESLEQHDKEDQELVSGRVDARSFKDENEQPKDFMMFGDSPQGERHAASSTVRSVQVAAKQERAASDGANFRSVDHRALVKVRALEDKDNNQVRGDESTINKLDFHQRRTELASKLHLAGMAKR